MRSYSTCACRLLVSTQHASRRACRSATASCAAWRGGPGLSLPEGGGLARQNRRQGRLPWLRGASRWLVSERTVELVIVFLLGFSSSPSRVCDFVFVCLSCSSLSRRCPLPPAFVAAMSWSLLERVSRSFSASKCDSLRRCFQLAS